MKMYPDCTFETFATASTSRWMLSRYSRSYGMVWEGISGVERLIMKVPYGGV